MKIAGITSALICVAGFLIIGCGGGAESAPSSHEAVTPALPALSTLPTSVKIPLNSGSSFGITTWTAGSTATGGNGQTIAGVECLVSEVYHIHSHLTIIEDGKVLAIPGQIGLQGCAYELHTHDSSGIIHVETQSFRKFTLGQFFAVWGKELTPQNIAGISGKPISVYINDNGVAVKYLGDPALIELAAHGEIAIIIGDVPSEIPSFQWAADL